MGHILPDGGGGTGGGRGGGGTTGTGTGSAGGPSTSGFPIGENGGVFASTYYLFVPMQNVVTGSCYIGVYDINDFNDPNDDAFYAYRAEDVNVLSVPTVRRVGLVYRDLGLVKLTVTITATNDNGQIVKASVQVQLGNPVPTNALITKFVDVGLVGFRPQLSISRAAGDGPLSIVSASMIGTCEDTNL